MAESDGGAERASRPDANGPVPTFGVRFESHDDFLVEYTDALRHGYVHLPLENPLADGTAVRLRVTLPDEAVLYVTGRALSDPDSAAVGRVKLDALSEAQRDALEKCVAALLGPNAEPDDDETDVAAGGREALHITVLLVDDSVSQRIELGDALRARKLRVRVAENGLVALSSALKRAPDVILTDVEMPQMDGWTLLRSVRQRKRLLHVPVVFLTRLSDELSRLRGYRMGVDDFLPKEMAADEIIARLHGVVARRRQLPPVTDAHGLRGDLEHVRLGSLLAFLESERRSGALRLRNGTDHATLHLRNGALGRVENLGRSQHPHDRVFELLSWRFGQFEFHSDDDAEGATLPANDGQETPLSYLLMEHARREDEAKA